ncbi:hypothetical protein VPNG_10392 [Cytospora leucostoma]|uniref:Uncharacterized protein n=1 Tax=Cytospora leucostoma TaxID=1230097 RepID=A0A423VB32_9PEZI|nr:hypothetical protein VPNG_10392 [Cytospora leucostoma]
MAGNEWYSHRRHRDDKTPEAVRAIKRLQEEFDTAKTQKAANHIQRRIVGKLVTIQRSFDLIADRSVRMDGPGIRVPIRMIKKIVADAALEQAEDDRSKAAMGRGILTGTRVLDREVSAADLLTDDDDE